MPSGVISGAPSGPRRSAARRGPPDGGAGLVSTIGGFVVFIVLLLFTVELLFGLYARTTVGAVASDVAQRAASSGDAPMAAAADAEAEARRRLGRYADDVTVTARLEDLDTDGSVDTIAVRIDARLPALVPTGWRVLEPGRFTRVARARLEVFQESA